MRINCLKSTLVFLFVACLSAQIIFVSCGGGGDAKEEFDTVLPTVSILQPTENQKVKAGKSLSMEIDLADNIQLSSYVVTIKYSGTKASKSVEEFSFNSLSDSDANGNALPTIIGKKTTKIKAIIEIDDSTMEGRYVMCCSVADNSNNRDEKSVDFVIER